MKINNPLLTICAIVIIVTTGDSAASLHNESSFMNETVPCAPVYMVQASSEKEWEAIRRFRQVYFFGPAGVQDPYEQLLLHEDHRHFLLYQGAAIVGYAHVQFWPEKQVMMRIMVIDEHLRGKGLGQRLMHLVEQWLRDHDYRVLCLDSRPSSARFYEKCGFKRAAFIDPEGYESDPQDIQMQKQL